jgi:DUF917 family protein
MPTRTISTVDEAEALLDGLTLLGTGGGGSPKEWRGLLREKIGNGESFTWTDLDEIDDARYGCTVFKTGSIAPANPQPELIKEMGFTEPRVENPMVEAVHGLGERLGVEIDVVFAVELGGINTPAPMSAAMDMDATLADGSCSDRSIPELDQIPAIAAGRDLAPAAVADTWGNKIVLEAAPSVSAAEHMVKSMAVFTQHPDPDAMCAVAMLAMPMSELRRFVVRDSLTLAFDVGTAMHGAIGAGGDPAQAAADAMGGRVLFAGPVVQRDWKDEGGYMTGTVEIEGDGDFDGHRLKVWHQNENHVTWLDDAPYVTSPDLIMTMDRKSGQPYTNADIDKGTELAIVGRAANPLFGSDEAITAGGPRHYGWDLEYRPFAEVVER